MDIQMETKQAIALYKRGEKQRAVEWLRKLANSNPNETKVWWALANTSSDLAEQHKAADQLLTLAPNSEKARMLKLRLPSFTDEPEFVSEIPEYTPPISGVTQPNKAVTINDTQPNKVVALNDTQPNKAVTLNDTQPPRAVNINGNGNGAVAATRLNVAPVELGQPHPSVASAITALIVLAGGFAVGAVALWQFSLEDPLQTVLGIVNSAMALAQAYLAVGVLQRKPGAAGRAHKFLSGTMGWCVLMIIQLIVIQGMMGSSAQIDVGGSIIIYVMWLVFDFAGQVAISTNHENLIAFDAEARKFVESAKEIAKKQHLNEQFIKSHHVQPFKQGRFKFHSKLFPYAGERLIHTQGGINFGSTFAPHLGAILFTDRRVIFAGSGNEVDFVMGQVAQFQLDHVAWSPDGRSAPTHAAHIIDSKFLVIPYAALVQMARDGGDMKISFRDSAGRTHTWQYKLNMMLKRDKEMNKFHSVLNAAQHGTIGTMRALDHKYSPA